MAVRGSLMRLTWAGLLKERKHTTMSYEIVTPSPVENATVQKYINASGAHAGYFVTPNEGYVLHDKGRDWEDIDPITGEPSTYHLGYTRGTATCGPNYNFSPVTVTDENGTTFTAYGSREFAARLETDVPADQIFNVGNNPEIM